MLSVVVGGWGTSQAEVARPGQKEVRRNLMASALGTLYRYLRGGHGGGRAVSHGGRRKDLLFQQKEKKLVSVGCTSDWQKELDPAI